MKAFDYKFFAIFFAFFSLTIVADNPVDPDETATETVEMSETTESAPMTTAVDEGDGDIENVVVTGSRFEISQYKTSQPITVITGDEIKRRGFTNAAAAVFDLPSVFATTSTSGEQTGLVAGQRIANNFGLGSGRTLTLIDGRRFISGQPIASYGSAATGAVDLNNIPTRLIKRIEIQSAGGSAVYGSDAIAGVINYVMDREYTGFGIDYNFSKSYLGDSDDVNGDHALALTFGGDFDDGKGHIVVAIQRDEQEEIQVGQLHRERDCNERIIQTRTYADGKTYQRGYYSPDMVWPNATVPQSEIGLCTVLHRLPFEGAAMDPRNFATRLVNWSVGAYDPIGYYNFTTSGDMVPQILGTSYGSGFFRYGGNNLASDNAETIRASLERTNLAVYLTYDITENTKFKLDVYSNRAESREGGYSTGGPYFYDGFGGDLDGGYYNYPFLTCDYPYFSAATTTFCNSLWPESTPAAERGMLIRKTLRDLYSDPRGQFEENQTDTNSYYIGFEGTFELRGNEMNWDVGYNHGSVDIFASSEDIVRERLVTATDVGINPATGEIDCKMNYVANYLGLTYGAANPYDSTRYHPVGFGSAGLPGDCIPYNPLGLNYNNPAGAYVMTDVRRETHNTQDIFYAELSGVVGSIPAGDVQFSMGIENREESLQFVGSSVQNLLLTRSTPIVDNVNSYDTDERYVEFSVPLIDDDMGLTFKGWGIKELRLDASYREIDNSFSGTYSVDAANIYMQISEGVALRGGTQSAVRTPDLVDVFEPQRTSYNSAQDPCDYRYIDLGVDPAMRRANCEAEPWFVDPFDSKIVNRTAEGRSGGNPNLLNELGDTTTIGLIYQPTGDWIKGDLSVGIDLVTIEISDTVESFSVTQNMNACYDYAAQEDKFCNTFTRLTDPADVDANNALGDVIDFILAKNNVGVRDFETYIINLDYSIETAVGDWGYRFRGYNQQEFESAPSSNPDDLVDYTGQYNEPEWIYDMMFTFNKNKWGVFYMLDGVSGGYINILQDMETQPDQYIGLDGNPMTKFKGYFTDRVAVTYEIGEETFVAVNLSNPFDLQGDESRFDKERGFRLTQSLSIGISHKF